MDLITILKVVCLPITITIFHKIICRCRKCSEWECGCIEGIGKTFTPKNTRSLSFSSRNSLWRQQTPW